MNTQELRAKTDDELNALLADLKKESFNLRFQRANGQMEKTHVARTARRQAATVLTILNERKLGLDKSAAGKKAKPAKAKAAKKSAAKEE